MNEYLRNSRNVGELIAHLDWQYQVAEAPMYEIHEVAWLLVQATKPTFSEFKDMTAFQDMTADEIYERLHNKDHEP